MIDIKGTCFSIGIVCRGKGFYLKSFTSVDFSPLLDLKLVLRLSYLHNKNSITFWKFTR